MEQASYEVFDHTADIGLNIYGATLEQLFIHAAQGMESLLVAPEQVHSRISREIHVDGQDSVALLIAWLNELIFLFDVEYLLFCDFQIDMFTDTQLSARVTGEQYDPARHDLGCAIKAATWHEASVRAQDTGYQARIIFDL